jgi:hypothetical protein
MYLTYINSFLLTCNIQPNMTQKILYPDHSLLLLYIQPDHLSFEFSHLFHQALLHKYHRFLLCAPTESKISFQ